MAGISIVNKGKGKQAESGKVWAEALSAEIEAIARREAIKNKVDITKERGGLMRAITQVMARRELVKEAANLARKKLEAEGRIPKEDPSIVKQPGKAV